MQLIDISVPITTHMPIWPGNPPVDLQRIRDMDKGEHNNVSRVSLGVHTGTHVDAPLHFVANGAAAERLPLDVLIGRALVIHLPDVTSVTAQDLRGAVLPPVERLLIRTRNSEWWHAKDDHFHQDMVGLSEDAARWIVAAGIKLVGVDYLSVAPPGMGTPVHRVLLEAATVIVEGLDLSDVHAGEYDLWCLPLKLVGSDGAPARAVLVPLDNRTG